jgi:single-strand DNA-binding protein
MINKVILLGRLGRDPEVRELANGKIVANVSLATSETYTDRVTGEKKENTEWHSLELWDKHAETARQYFRKGMVLYVEGRIKTDKFKDAQTGEEKQRTKIRVIGMQMLGGGSGGAGQYERTAGDYHSGDSVIAHTPETMPDDPANDDLPF